MGSELRHQLATRRVVFTIPSGSLLAGEESYQATRHY